MVSDFQVTECTAVAYKAGFPVSSQMQWAAEYLPLVVFVCSKIMASFNMSSQGEFGREPERVIKRSTGLETGKCIGSSVQANLTP